MDQSTALTIYAIEVSPTQLSAIITLVIGLSVAIIGSIMLFIRRNQLFTRDIFANSSG
jgi:hypothetical protein